MNGLYTKGKEALLDGSIIWTTSNIKVMLVDTTLYAADLVSDQFLSSIPPTARVNTSPLLTNRTATDGVADADDVTLSVVTHTGDIGAYVIFSDTGSVSSSRLLAYRDDAPDFPFTPTGGSVVITWSNDTSKVFSL